MLSCVKKFFARLQKEAANPPPPPRYRPAEITIHLSNETINDLVSVREGR